jgi:hypothetical protein
MAKRPSWYPPKADHYRKKAATHCRDAAKVLLALADGIEAETALVDVAGQLRGALAHVVEAHADVTVAGVLVEQASDDNDRPRYERSRP